jgi:ribonuclease HI
LKARTLEDILRALHIKEWDYLIVGDGSATTWDHEMGWGSTVIARAGFLRPPPFHGSFSRGTNIMAEMMAFVHPLLWLASQKLGRAVVHVLTDCEIVRNCGKGVATRKANSELWFMVSAFSRKGIHVHYHWIPRDTIALNKLAHDLANKARLDAKALATNLGAVMGKHGATIYDVNPSV